MKISGLPMHVYHGCTPTHPAPVAGAKQEE